MDAAAAAAAVTCSAVQTVGWANRNADQVVGLGRNDHGEGRSDRALGHRRCVVRRRRGEQAGTRPRGLSAAPPRQSIERRCGGIGVGGLLQALLRGQRKQVDLRTARHRRPRCGLTHLKSETPNRGCTTRAHLPCSRRARNPDPAAPQPPMAGAAAPSAAQIRHMSPAPEDDDAAEPVHPNPGRGRARPAPTARSSRGITRPING